MSEIKVLLSEKFVASVKPRKTLCVYCDKKNPNLKLYVRPSGAKSYVFRAKQNGKDKKRKLGDVSSTNLSTAKLLVESYAGKINIESTLGLSESRLVDVQLTVNDVFERYKNDELKYRSTIAGRTHHFEIAYNLHLKSQVGDYLVCDVTKKVARTLFMEIEKKGYATHNKLLSCLKSAFNYLIDFEEDYESILNPFDRIKKMPGINRNRYLTHEEASKLLLALSQVSNQNVADIYRIALFTGARLSNVKQMLWSDIDLQSGTWFIPATQTKTKQHYEIPLHSLAMDILRIRQHAVGTSSFVFPSRNKSKYGYITGGDPIWKQAIKLAGLYHENPNIRPRPHDLRRTFATWQIQSGADISVVSKALCHTSLKHTMIYAHTNTSQIRSAIDGAFDFLK
tara:strand:+ start:8369 stop:9556 length:1188 start_codon:yes stop_codon:yes gene_type:complete